VIVQIPQECRSRPRKHRPAGGSPGTGRRQQRDVQSHGVSGTRDGPRRAVPANAGRKGCGPYFDLGAGGCFIVYELRAQTLTFPFFDFTSILRVRFRGSGFDE
jgi:hypothetical protein